MPATKLGGVPNWQKPIAFMEKYKLEKSSAYDLISEEDFPKMRTGKRRIRVDLNATDEWFARKYN